MTSPTPDLEAALGRLRWLNGTRTPEVQVDQNDLRLLLDAYEALDRKLTEYREEKHRLQGNLGDITKALGRTPPAGQQQKLKAIEALVGERDEARDYDIRRNFAALKEACVEGMSHEDGWTLMATETAEKMRAAVGDARAAVVQEIKVALAEAGYYGAAQLVEGRFGPREGDPCAKAGRHVCGPREGERCAIVGCERVGDHQHLTGCCDAERAEA